MSADRERNERRAELQLQVGTSLLMKGNYPQALSALLDAERLDPKNPIIQNNLGLAYLVREKMDAAERRFKAALKLSPKYTDARNNLGRLYIEVGMYKDAIRELTITSTDLTYDQPDKSWYNLGQAYFLNAEYGKAREALENSLREKRENCFAMNLYGRSLFELKSYKPAIESLDQAIKLCEKSKFDEPYFYSGLSYYKSGNIERATARFNEMIEQFPNSKYSQKVNELLEIRK